MSSEGPEKEMPEGFQPHAALAALVFPGGGHALLGDLRRGACVAAGVLGLFFGGLFIGGIDVIDSKEDRVWFLGQAFVGPIAFGVDYLHQNHFKVREPTGRLRSANPNETRGQDAVPVIGTPPNRKSIAKVNELGTLFAAIAGMMNLIAVIDAAYPTARHRGRHDKGGAEPAGGEKTA